MWQEKQESAHATDRTPNDQNDHPFEMLGHPCPVQPVKCPTTGI